MKSADSSPDGESRPGRTTFGDPQFMRVVKPLSRVVTVIFLVALVWALYEAFVTGNRLPAWAWLGTVTLFAVAVGLIVMVIVYRGVAEQVGPFDFRPTSRVTGQLKSEARRVDAAGATSLRAEIKMTQGVLQLLGGAMTIMDAEFNYDDADWRPPEVAYAVDTTGRGELVVEQRATHRPAMRQGRSEWLIRLNPDLPTDLKVKFGAGKAKLKFGGLSLERLRVESGVGELILDLSGEWQRSLEAFIKAGIGDTTLQLPQNAGVRVRSTVGFGSLQAGDLTWDGEAYTNALYGQAAVNLEITVEGGMGKISLL